MKNFSKPRFFSKKTLTAFAPILVIAVTGMVVYTINNTNTDTRRDASSYIQPEVRETLAQIDAKELSGEALKVVVDREQKYVERQILSSKVEELLLSSSEIDKNSELSKKYQEEFGLDLSELDETEINSLKNMTIESQFHEEPVFKGGSDGIEKEGTQDIENKEQSSTKLIQKVSAQSGGGSGLPGVGQKKLPTIEGFNVEKFTGIANISYPIDIPPIRGNIPYSLNLDYSSRRIDELRLNKPKKIDWSTNNQNDNWERTAWPDKNWDQVVGLGWDFNNLQKIVIRPNVQNEFMIQWQGRQVIIKDLGSGNYKTVPDIGFKISRLDTGRWRLIDKDGTNYIFGDNLPYPGGENPPRPSTSTFVDYTFGWSYGSEGTPYCWLESVGWNLSEIIDVNGNSMSFEVEASYGQQFIGSGYWGCTAYWTDRVLLKKVKYNYNERNNTYASTIDFVYSNMKFKDNSDSHMVKRLNIIEAKNMGRVISRYELLYKSTLNNPLWNGLKNYTLLTEIKRKGIGGVGEEKSYTFCYDSVTSTAIDSRVCANTDVSDARSANILNTEQKRRDYKPNTMYLVDADNGYGGKVQYFYEKVNNIDKICLNHKKEVSGSNQWARFCTGEVTDLRAFTGDAIYADVPINNRETSFYRVSKILASNGTASTLNAHYKLKVTKYEYLGQTQAFAKELKRHDADGYKYLGFEGLLFYGYDTVRTKVYEPESEANLDTVRTFLTHTEEKTKLSVSRGAFTNNHGGPSISSTTCFMPDPRKGMVHESKVLDQSGNNVIGFNNTLSVIGVRGATNFEWITSDANLAQKCYPDASGLPAFVTLTRETYSNIDGKESKSQTFYDYDFDLNLNNSFGNPVKQKDFGIISNANDDIYTYTKYMNGLTNTVNWMAYKDKNLTGLPILSFKSSIDANPVTGANPYAQIDAIDPKLRYGLSEMKYDERLTEWGYQPGVSGVKGLVSKSKSIYYGSNFDNQTNRVELSSYTDYNKYGYPTRTNAPWTEGNTKGLQSATYYDDRYFMYPVCQLQARRKGASFDPNANWKTVCNSNADVLATKYEYAQTPTDEASWDDGLSKGLMYFTTDPNGARSRYEYDHYGRVTKVFEPDPNILGQIRSVASQEATYYDNLVPMRQRIKSRSVVVDEAGNIKDIKKTVDSIIDGFGNELESIMYSNWYDKEQGGTFTKVPYAIYSRVDFNGVGQVTKKTDNVKLENKQMPETPEKLAGGTELTPSVMAEATITETKYDLLNRPYEVTVTTGQGTAEPLVTKEKITYAGYITRTEDARGTTSEVEVDPRGLTKRTTTYICSSASAVCNASVAGAVAVNTRTDYHPVLLQPTAIFDTNNIQVQGRVYNNAGMVLRVGDRDRGPMFNYYDNAGRLEKVVNSKGDSIESSYDEMNRVVTATMKNKAGAVRRIEEMVYDTNKLGQLYQRKLKDYTVSQTRYLQIVTTEHDFVGRVTKSTNKALDLTNPAVLAGTQEKYIEVSKNPQYTVTGTVKESNTKVKNPNFNSGAEYVLDKTFYRYDDDGKLLRAIDKTTGTDIDLIKSVKYTFNGQPYAIALGNNTIERYTYDRMKRLSNKTVRDSANAIVFDMTYGYETRNGLATGLINTAYSNTFQNEKSAFKYDSLGRLEGTVNDNNINKEYSATYQFDVVGNLLKKSEQAVVYPDMAGPVNASADNVFLTSHILGNASNPEPNKCKLGEYSTKVSYDANVNGCPYHGVMKSTFADGKVVFYSYNYTGSTVKEFDGQGLWKEYKYDVLDMPVEYWERVNGAMKLIAKYYYGLDGQRIAKLTY